MPRMSDRDDETTGEPWSIRPRSVAERVEWSVRQARISRSRIRDRKAFGLVVWAVTCGVILVMLSVPSGTVNHDDGYPRQCPAVLDATPNACAGEHVHQLGRSLLVLLPGFVLGTILFVPSRRDIIPGE